MNSTTSSPGTGAPPGESPPAVLSPLHREYLNAHAVSDEVITTQGITSDGGDIVFTWREGDHVTEQRRPWPGGAGVYYWAAGEDLHLNVLQDPGPEATVLLCEGTKQSLAVASWAPPEYAVMGMPGCYGWTMSRKLDLSRFAGRRVLVMLDADAAGNLDVYEAGERLASELAMEDPPATALFIPSPAWGKDGIDDYLGRIAPERRADRLAKLIAKAQDKPADKRPAKRKVRPATEGRPMILVDGDRRDTIHQILGAMRSQWDGRDLFCYGGVLTRLREARTEPLGKGAFLRWMSEAVACFRRGGESGYAPAWPDPQTTEALMASADEFVPLDRVTSVPFLREDGTVCAKNGYDPSSRTMLVTGNSGMDRLDIPDAPSAEEAAAAAQFLLDGWLGDDPVTGKRGMPWRDDASRANALALILTPFIRGIVPLVPLAVISGLQMGVGKNLLADCFSLMATGQNIQPLPWVADDDDEIRKQLLSSFRAGSQLACFDEAHVIGGPALTRALTALTYADRILGVSEMAYYPNRVTWMALGNQVSVLADMSRRVYFIELHPDVPDPQDRPEEAFAHPDPRGWTTGNRPELVTAALVMIRAWFAAGQPPFPRGALMGSFEAWDKMMSGILGYAGVPGFLSNLAGKRAEADFSGGYWHEHVAWLRSVFGDSAFTILEVIGKAQASSGTWDAPPGLDDLLQRGYARNLGQAYSRHQDRWFGPLRIVKTGLGHRSVVKWVIQERGGAPEGSGGITTPDLLGRDEGGNARPSSTPPVSGRDGGTGGILSPLAHMHAPAHDAPAHTCMREEGKQEPSGPSIPPSQVSEFTVLPSQVSDGALFADPPIALMQPPAGLKLCADLETADASLLFRRKRGYAQSDGSGFVRLAGMIGPGGQPVITDAPTMLAIFEQATEITGHNFLGFDGLALAWHHGADWEKLAAKVRDTEIIARQWKPPRSRETHSDDKYDLDSVAALLGLPGKTDDLRRLKREHGGYDKIPLGDPEYRAYLEGDLRATAAVAERLNHDDYTRREHKLASLAGRMSLNGFAVDRDLLERRLAAGEERKQQALQVLHDGWGLPLTKTVTRGRGSARTEAEEDVTSPLSTDAGRAWLEAQYERYQVHDPPRTAKTGKLALGEEDLKRVTASPRCPGDLRAMITLMGIVTGTRTVYQTARDRLAPDGRVHPRISMRQSSGRWSTTDPGLTVFGKHGGRHVERDIFPAEEGCVLFSCDLSQVDMRAMAGHSQDPAYMAMFAPGQDAHEQIAAQVGLTRQQAKAIGHGWNYGLGAGKMIRGGLDPDAVSAFIRGMEARFPRLIAWREEIRSRGAAGEILDNGFGRRMACDPQRAYTVAPALMGQGGAGDIMKEVLLRLDSRAPELRPYYRVMVHDEQVFSVPEKDAPEIIETVREAFTWEWRSVPILCDINGPGRTWGEISGGK